MAEGGGVTLRPGTRGDLAGVNAVVEAAVMGWDLPERVKRLSMDSYRYHDHDLDHVALLVAEADGAVVGVAATEDADPADCPEGKRALLLHGLYVLPGHQGQGLGRRLLAAVAEEARGQGYAGVLVKANKDAQGFFAARGLGAVPVQDPGRDYPYRFWLDLGEV